ncbi:hypothetical protein U1Q18_009240 [Sarracenia purpurea var. burkii]
MFVKFCTAIELQVPHREGLGTLILSLLPLVRRRNHWYFGVRRLCRVSSDAVVTFWIPAISQCPLPVLLQPFSWKVRDGLGATSGALEVARLELSLSSNLRVRRGSLPPGLLVVSSGGIS